MNPEQHFDRIAEEYDYWKKKNWYYYHNLKALYKSLIPPGKRVWDIGCGTGDILTSLEPAYGYGTDVSRGMIEVARRKHRQSNFEFEALDVAGMTSTRDFDYIILADVLEHVPDLNSFIGHVARLAGPKTGVVISVVNPLWENQLMIAEKLHLKMPEGPHWRLSNKENEAIFAKNGFEIIEKGYRTLIPKKLPGSDLINSRFYKNRLLAPLGFNIYWVLKRSGKVQ